MGRAEPYSDEASALLENWQKQRRRLTPPALFAYEATNALAKRVKNSQLALEVAKGWLASVQCECWTADERLWNTVKNELPWVGQHAVAVRS